MTMPKKISTTGHLPKHCVSAPKKFVPMRIKLQRQRKAQEELEAQQKVFMDDCADWQEYIELTESLEGK